MNVRFQGRLGNVAESRNSLELIELDPAFTMYVPLIMKASVFMTKVFDENPVEFYVACNWLSTSPVSSSG